MENSEWIKMLSKNPGRKQTCGRGLSVFIDAWLRVITSSPCRLLLALQEFLP